MRVSWGKSWVTFYTKLCPNRSFCDDKNCKNAHVETTDKTPQSPEAEKMKEIIYEHRQMMLEKHHKEKGHLPSFHLSKKRYNLIHKRQEEAFAELERLESLLKFNKIENEEERLEALL